MTFSVMDKTIVVTGATSGIGFATAEALTRQGAHVIGVGRSVQRCRAAEQKLAAAHARTGSVAYLTADLTLQREVRRLANEIRSITAGRGRAALDGLVNNAGTFTYWLALTRDPVGGQPPGAIPAHSRTPAVAADCAGRPYRHNQLRVTCSCGARLE